MPAAHLKMSFHTFSAGNRMEKADPLFFSSVNPMWMASSRCLIAEPSESAGEGQITRTHTHAGLRHRKVWRERNLTAT